MIRSGSRRSRSTRGVIAAALDVRLVWLAAFAVVMSVVGAFYYLRIVKLMYFDELAAAAPE